MPGCILRLEFALITLCSIADSWIDELPGAAGDFGPIWISVGGGGLGSLGELGVRDMIHSLPVKLRWL